jgi:leucyl-tRNA synthetase
MDCKAIHKKWEKFWADTKAGVFNPKNKQPKYYCLVMWPYPSAAGLHLGHAINYMPADTHARFKRMQGFNVFQPVGFDSFGLPAENHALKTGTHPKINTEKNVANMRRQLLSLGCMYDWTHELNSSDPTYYKWTQWLFVQLFNAGLAYRKEAAVNWCDNCKTVIANEQVINGECERCHNKITRRFMKQWFFKITAYADELLSGLDEICPVRGKSGFRIDWPEKTKIMQRNWIGKSTGTRIKFGDIEVFTTRIDTILGVTFLVLAPEHPLVQNFITEKHRKECEEYIRRVQSRSDIERTADTTKTGVFTGSYVPNPATGEQVPVWLADYVLVGYGTGAVMGVPAYDGRDREFAEKFNLPIKKEKLVPDIKIGTPETSYRLRDWSIGRQRYWGCPIPIVYCEKCGMVAETRLPVILPDLKDFLPKGDAPLSGDSNFVNCTCPECGGPAKRETETMDTFVCSSFYFLRFLDTRNCNELLSKDICEKNMPVDKYIGGAEHACMHLLYARFIMRFLYKQGIVNTPEPFKSLVHQGMILGIDGTKMSKSRGNIIEPDKYITEYGSDALRLYLLFGFNYIEGGPWNDNAFRSVARFIDRISNLLKRSVAGSPKPARRSAGISAAPVLSAAPDKKLLVVLNKTIRSVTNDLENFSFNTAVARCMELINALYASKTAPEEVLRKLVLLLAPMMPHFGEEWFHWLNPEKTGSVFDEPFPAADPHYLTDEETEIAVQINSKIVGRLTVPTDAEEKFVADKCAGFITGKKVVKTICVKNKLINFICLNA